MYSSVVIFQWNRLPFHPESANEVQQVFFFLEIHSTKSQQYDFHSNEMSYALELTWIIMYFKYAHRSCWLALQVCWWYKIKECWIATSCMETTYSMRIDSVFPASQFPSSTEFVYPRNWSRLQKASCRLRRVVVSPLIKSWSFFVHIVIH